MRLKLLLPIIAVIACFGLVTFKTFAAPPIYNLSETPNPKQYNIHISGFYYLTNQQALKDINGNGKADLIVTGRKASSDFGIYIFYDDLLNVDGLGNTINATNGYSVYIHSTNSAALTGLGNYFDVADVTNDNLPDLIVSASSTDYNTRTNSGSVYIIPNSVFANKSGTGNIIDILGANAWTTRIDGANASDALSASDLLVGDYNSDGKNDLAICTPYSSYNTRTKSGSCYLLDNAKISQTSTFGTVTKDLSSTTNFDIRFDGPPNGTFGLSGPQFGDFNGDDKLDFLISDNYAQYPGRTNPGSVFIIENTKLTTSNPSKSVDLNDPNSYSTRFYGANKDYLLTTMPSNSTIKDLDKDGKTDLIFAQGYYLNGNLINTFLTTPGSDIDLSSPTNYDGFFSGSLNPMIMVDLTNESKFQLQLRDWSTDFSGTDFASTYFISPSVLDNFTEENKTYSISENSGYLARFDGGNKGTTSWDNYRGDINGDGTSDYIFSSCNPFTSADVWVVYNFPHTISSSSISGLKNANPLIATGNVSATNSISKIKGVQYNINNNQPDSDNWKECTASDGQFNSLNEEYLCDIEDLSNGSDTVYFRAYDDKYVYTHQSEYSSQTFKYDGNKPGDVKIGITKSKLYEPGEKDVTINKNEFKLYFHSGDSTSSVKKVMVSQNSKFKGASWKDYDGDINLKFDNDGKKNIYVKFKDEAGNISKVYKQIIKVDTTAPDLTVSSIGGLEYDQNKYNIFNFNTNWVVFSGSSEKDSEITIAIDGIRQDQSVKVDESGKWTLPGLNISNGSHKIEIKSFDELENYSKVEFTLNIDSNAQ